MRLATVLLRASILLFSALCLLIFQFGTSILVSTSRAYAEQPFPTVVPIDPDFEDPIDEDIAVPIPIPTIGPGSAFNQDDPNRPQVKDIEEGDSRFGYGPMAGSDELYVAWTTDNTGTHYLVVHKDSDYLRGTRDSATGGRYENGFDNLIKQREVEKLVRDEDIAIRDSRESTADTALGIRVVVAVGGGVACIVATLGFCGAIIGLGGAFLVGAFASQATALDHDASARVHSNAIREMERRQNSRTHTYSEGDLVAPTDGG